ncbi:MAG: hypothetical protein H7X97_05115 [Opitutaceae bacterium]|nr:hypothetical protein [Verrucomicrobiales bacterium]
MKNSLNQWMPASAEFQGFLACGVRFPDQTVISHTTLADLEPATIEIALRGLADTFQVLDVHRIPASRFRWVYQQGFVHCVQRPDNILLGVFTSRVDLDAAALESFINGFLSLRESGS